MSNRTKKILNFALIFGTLAIVLYIGFSGQEIGSILQALESIEARWILLCAGAYVAFVLLDSASLWYFIRRQGYSLSFASAVFVSVEGAYYADITPGASGGQPMQIYYLNKRKIPIGISTSALTVKFFCFQFMLQVIATVAWITNAGYIAEQVGGNMWILIMGYTYNAVCVGFVLMMAFNKALVGFFIDLFIRIGVLLHLCKDPQGAKTRWSDHLETFHSSVMMLTRNPINLLIQLALGAAQLLVQTFIIFFLFHAFHLEGSSLWQIVAMGVMQYVSAAYAPLPGASGAQEGVFALYFSGIFPDGVRFMALLLWRFFNYYMALITGAVTTVIHGFINGKRYTE